MLIALHYAGADFFGLLYGKFEDRAPILLHVMEPLVDGFVRCRPEAAARRHAERWPAATVNLVGKIDDAATVGRRAHHHRSRAVAEQHACRPVCVVDDARHDVGAYGQRVPMRAGRDHVGGGGQRVRESRTRGAEIESPRAVGADLVLDEARGARKHHVGCGRADDDEVDVVRSKACLGDGFESRLFRKIGCRDAGIDDVPFPNAGALKNPLVRCVDEFFQVLVGEQAGRHKRRETADLRRTIAGVFHHKPLPGAVNPK